MIGAFMGMIDCLQPRHLLIVKVIPTMLVSRWRVVVLLEPSSAVLLLLMAPVELLISTCNTTAMPLQTRIDPYISPVFWCQVASTFDVCFSLNMLVKLVSHYEDRTQVANILDELVSGICQRIRTCLVQSRCSVPRICYL